MIFNWKGDNMAEIDTSAEGARHMSAPNGWPYPERPGVPENPERDGWHWLLANSTKDIVPEAACWRAPRSRYPGMWFFQGNENYLVAEQMTQAHGWRGYLGPCLTPAEVAAREAAAAAAIKAECSRRLDQMLAEQRAGPHGSDPRDRFEAWLDDGDDALARVRAEAMREGMERAVKVAIEYGHTDDGDVFRIVEMIVKAIRAAAQEIK
jgi:hypothetical protein